MREIKKSGWKLKEVQMGVNASISNVKNGFVGTGYYLGIIRSEELWKEDGSASFDEYMNKNYQKDKSWASKCISVYDQFGEQIAPGEKPRLRAEYQEYNVSQLFELIYLPEDKRDEVTSEMPVRAIRELKPKKEKKVSTVETPEPPKWNTDPTPCIHREEYSCTVPDDKKSIPGDGSNCGQSCCWECQKRGDCKWECNCSQLRPEEPTQISELDFSSRTEITLNRAGIDTVDKLASMSDVELATVRGMSTRTLEEIRTKLEDKPEPETVVDVEFEEVQPDHSERVYTLEEVAQEIYRLEAAYMGAPEEIKQSNHYRKNMMRLDAMRLLYEDIQGN